MQIHEIEMRMPTPDGQSMLAWHRTIRISRSIPHLNLRSSVLEVARVLPLLATQELGLFHSKTKQQKKSTYEFSFVRPRRDDKICGERNNDSYDAFDNKDPDELPSMLWLWIIIDIFLPLPSFSTTYTIHLTNNIRENTAEGARKCCPSKENSNTPAAFMSIFSRRPIVIL